MAVVALAVPKVLAATGHKSAADKADYWRAFERVRIAWYRSTMRSCAREFELEKFQLLPILRNAGTAGTALVMVEQAINQRDRQWDAWLRERYELVGTDFARRVTRGFEQKTGPGPTSTKAEDELIDVWLVTIREWLGEQAGVKIRSITETTRKMLMEQLREGVYRGESIPKLAARLRDSYDQFSLTRAVTIARTEVIAASNLGSRAGALSTGLVLNKVWLATADTRTRPHHDQANEQTTALNEPYVVNGELLMFPGDGSMGATASNLVSCRCSEYYVEVRASRAA